MQGYTIKLILEFPNLLSNSIPHSLCPFYYLYVLTQVLWENDRNILTSFLWNKRMSKYQ